MNWAEPRPLFETLCATCDGQRRIVGHHPRCNENDCMCQEWGAWLVRCPDCSPDLVPEIDYRPERAFIPY